VNKTAIKNFAVWARRKLISDITYKAGLLGINEAGISEPLPISTDNIQFFDIGTGKPTEIANDEIKQRKGLVTRIREKESTSDYKTAYQYVVEEVAYTWFNRLIAIRFMEVNDYLPSRVRVLSSHVIGKAEPDIIATPYDTDLEFTAYEQDRIMQLKDENKLDELFRMLFIKQCNKLNEVLPGLFEGTSDYTELLLNISFIDQEGIVKHLINDIVEDDFLEAVEIIGWMYQYYNIEPKAVVDAYVGKSKVPKEDVPAKTQLFTPEWIVRYMVENSLGRIWSEKCKSQKIPCKVKEDWKYYLEEAEQVPNVEKQLDKLRSEYKDKKLEDMKVIDPCMGSGHILVYAFEILMQIYESSGYSSRDAAGLIIKNNLYGLDIDDRAYQLSYFAVMMKGRKYDRRFLIKGIKPNLCAIQESNGLNSFEKGAEKLEIKAMHKQTANYLINVFKDAKEYGSILNIEEKDFTSLLSYLKELHKIGTEDMPLYIWLNDILNIIPALIKQGEIMASKYDVVITNPPYFSGSYMSPKLSRFVNKEFPNSKTDMFAVFIEKCLQISKANGYVAMITMHSWMFLSSYEKLRRRLATQDIINMVHLGSRAFEEIGGEVVQTTAFVYRKEDISKYKSTYIRLVDYKSENAKKEEFLKSLMMNTDKYLAAKGNFAKIPGMPIAYWVSDVVYNIFSHNKLFKTEATPRKGLDTNGNGDYYFRLWYEVSQLKIYSGGSASKLKYKWFEIDKGGEFRRWYGNRSNIINYENNGVLLKGKKPRANIRNEKYYFMKALTYGVITSSDISIRTSSESSVFYQHGANIFTDEDKYLYVLGLSNSKVMKLLIGCLAPTLSYTVGDVAKVPIIHMASYSSKINQIVSVNIELSKNDWDSFENSFDFKSHPLLKWGILINSGLIDYKNIRKAAPINIGVDKTNDSFKIYEKGSPTNGLLETSYNMYDDFTQTQFTQLKSNEEELNRIFIEIYGLQDELTPEVEDKDITIRKADLQRDIRSFLSYAVGCMFGRYSLDIEGLAFAGGDWDDSKYTTFIPDKDNIIPITDEEYFDDDIVARFISFVKLVYGENTLEENLDFIANALGNKGNTYSEIIRNYFLKEFYKDHVKGYKKRPIYWLFDSGKENGFKALIYMHRYTANTTGIVRVDYLHKMQKIYTNEIDRMQDMIENSTHARDVAKAEKRKEKLIKQLKETKEYDEKIAHIALSRIDIDLDDGVKVNYKKVQTGKDNRKIDILAKI
jgi:hypothetical protein